MFVCWPACLALELLHVSTPFGKRNIREPIWNAPIIFHLTIEAEFFALIGRMRTFPLVCKSLYVFPLGTTPFSILVLPKRMKIFSVPFASNLGNASRTAMGVGAGPGGGGGGGGGVVGERRESGSEDWYTPLAI
ncbi:unnamed protein product, partial [Owenia fusiformis]